MFKRIDLAKFVFSNLRCISINEFYILVLYRLNGRLLCYVRGFTQLPQKRKAATYFEGPGGHGQPLLDGSYVTQRVRLAYSKPGSSTGRFSLKHVRLTISWLRVRPPAGRQNSSMDIDHEIFSTAILSLPLIQEGQLSVSGESMCTILLRGLPTQ